MMFKFQKQAGLWRRIPCPFIISVMLKSVFAIFFFITFDRIPWTINIFLSLDMVIERNSLSFVGYIATHHSHTSSIEPILMSVLT